MTKQERTELFGKVRRVIIKVGTSILTTANNRLDASYLEELVEEIAAVRRKDIQVALVTSGAIAAGMKSLGLAQRPKDVSTLQAAAAVGQSNLMRTYERLFKEQGFVVGQVLLTRDIIHNPLRSRNAQNTFERLFAFGAIPIINENDAIAVDEIRFGDNDTLSALVLKLTAADLLIILSDVDGLYVKGVVCTEVRAITPEILAAAKGSGSENTTGGMVTKLQAAKIVLAENKVMVIAHGRKDKPLLRILSGVETGTAFLPG